jgi:hypothetical protein
VRRLGLVFVLLSMTSAAFGQFGQFSIPSVFSTSNSIIDQNGNLIVLDVSYSYPPVTGSSLTARFPTVAKTHVSVITVTTSGANKTSFDYAGALQILGVGRHGVYAVVSTYTPSTTPLPTPAGNGSAGTSGGPIALPPIVPVLFTMNRKLVVMNAVAGTLPASLPSIDLLSGDEVKISAAGDSGPLDTIALIDSPLWPPILASATTSSSSHSVRLFTFDGGSFAPVNQTPIPVP